MPPKGPKAAPKAGGKKGPPNAMLAKLKMKMEMQAAEEERLKQEALEEERRIREEEKLAEEQRKFEEEERAREKERQKELERRERKEKKGSQNTNALDRMRASGFIVPDVDEIRKRVEEDKERAKLEPPKPKPKPKQAVAPPPPPPPESESESEDDGEMTEATESDIEVDEDDWEALMERDDRRATRHSNNDRIRSERVQRKGEKVAMKAAALQKLEEDRQAREHTLEKISNLRSPICCVVGHVDTGKTSLLDRLRRSNVQGGEAGGITQQIGATFYPRDTLEATTKILNEKLNYNLNVPGLLFIDTPGHESFTNLRSRGTSLCDIAVLVVDIMHGLEQQTIESIALLQQKKCPFIIALNKVDRLYDWQVHENMGIQESLSLQKPHVRAEFMTRVGDVKKQLAGEGGKIKLANKTARSEQSERGPRTKVEAKAVYAELYYENQNDRNIFSIVPISAKTGEGIPDLLLLEVKLVQQFMEGKVTYKDDLQCTVLEVKPVTGLGFTVDAILINGQLKEGDEVCFCGASDEPIFTQIRSLLTPQPLSELRIKGDYVHHNSITAAMGVKITANDLEHVVPGTSMMIVRSGADKAAIGREVMKDATNVKDHIDPNGIGVLVQSSTMGALEALISFLHDNNVPAGSIGIGPLHRRHMHLVTSVKQKAPRYAIVLAFDVPISEDAREVAKKNGIRIFESDTIYKLFDMFEAYNKEYEEQQKARLRETVVYPVRLRIIDDAIHATDPIILPIQVERGKLLPGTPLGAVRGETIVPIGRVMSMEKDNRAVARGDVGSELAVKINSGESGVTYDRHFSKADSVVSLITRTSVNAIKELKELLSPKDFEAEMNADELNLLATLVKALKVPK